METKTPLLAIVQKLVKAAGVQTEFETQAEFHLRLEQEAYMPLVIESWPAPKSYLGEKRHISVAHYFIQNGDPIADPDVLMTDAGYPIEIQQVLGYTQVMTLLEANQLLVDRDALRNISDFMAMWAKTISSQGWLEVAANEKKRRQKNPCAKRVTPEKAYEVWQTDDGSWTWYVLKKYQTPEREAKNHYAAWFCFVTSPFVPDGEYGDTYVSNITSQAHKIDYNPLQVVTITHIRKGADDEAATS